MIYQEQAARVAAKKWNSPRSTVRRWERLGILPDCRILDGPLTKADQEIEEKLIQLVEAGWLKARTLGWLVCAGDRINALITARRYPDDSRYHVRHLKATEIKYIRPILEKLQRSLGLILYLADLTPDGQEYNAVVQADLRALLRCDYLSGANVRAGMDKRQVGRFWAFMRGQAMRINDLSFVLDKLKGLLTLLTVA